jgi:hypothetical protein
MKRSGLLVVLSLVVLGAAVSGQEQPVTDPAKADADFAVQGEYVGTVAGADGKPAKYGIQVVAQSLGKFRAYGHQGGLPGDGWDKSKKVEADGQTKDGITVFPKLLGSATIKDQVLTITGAGGAKVGELKRVLRQSPTLGSKPPEGAIVLFDATTGAEHFPGAKLTDDKYLGVPATSKRFFAKDFALHIEFRIPYRTHGNSGVYLQGSYELQLLQSFGKNAGVHDCGAIYGVRAPDVNMTFPPLSWQTYDVDYQVGKFDADGKITQPPVTTVRHNGVVIHEKVELPDKPTGGGRALSPKGGPLFLQPYGNPTAYRNIWVVEK